MLTTRESKVLKMLEDEVLARQEEIVSGSLDHVAYKDMTGFVRGLKLAAEYLQYQGQQD